MGFIIDNEFSVSRDPMLLQGSRSLVPILSGACQVGYRVSTVILPLARHRPGCRDDCKQGMNALASNARRANSAS